MCEGAEEVLCVRRYFDANKWFSTGITAELHKFLAHIEYMVLPAMLSVMCLLYVGTMAEKEALADRRCLTLSGFRMRLFRPLRMTCVAIIRAALIFKACQT